MLAATARRDEIDFTYATPHQSLGRRSFIRTVEKLGGQPRLKRLYHRYLDDHRSSKDFFQSAIDLLGLKVHFDSARLDAVPKDGPVVFMANHPYGVLDGLVLTWLARQARPDIKVMANHVLCQAPDALDHLLPVDFTRSEDAGRTDEAIQTNISSRLEAQAMLRAGGAVGIFPAGSVGASEKPLKGPAVDSVWHPFAAKLVMMSKATVVPVYFAGQNSRIFQLASHVSYTWRLSLFFWETARRIGTDLEVAIGEPIRYADIPDNDTRETLIRDLRKRTFDLASTVRQRKGKLPRFDQEFAFPNHIRF